MRMNRILLSFAAILLFNSYAGFSLDEEVIDQKKFLVDAELYFEKENYLAALPIYLKLDSLDPSLDYKFKIGICYLHKGDEQEKSIEYLEQVQEKKPKTKGLSFYLGKGYHLNYRFDEAIGYLNLALKTKKITEEEVEKIERLMENCVSGKKYFENPLAVKIENIGSPINTEGSEYGPVISADESIMIFTYRGEMSKGGLQNEYAESDPMGKYFEDVFMSIKLGGESWSEPEPIGENINIRGHDASLALSPTGQQLFIYKDTKDADGEIYVSELDGYVWSEPVPLDSTVNTTSWEGSVSLSADGTTLYFASDRPGGQGGRDIYVSTRMDNGSWGKARNLGPIINTPFQDEAPFIHPDGKTLYFSSKGHSSMGGYDIFTSTVRDDSIWSVPENLAYPINTTDDDKYYVVSADGARGYYSSKKSGSYGLHDIYVVYLGEHAKEHEMILVKGRVLVNDQVASSEIVAEFAETNEPYEGYFKSNSATGKYIVILPAENNYNLSYEVEGLAPYVENINASEISTYTEIVRDINLYSDDYERRLDISGTLIDENGEKIVSMVVKVTSVDGTITEEAVTDENGNFTFKQLENKHLVFTLEQEMQAVVTGMVLSGKDPKEGVNINAITTNVDGGFTLEFDGTPVVAVSEITLTENVETDVVITENVEPVVVEEEESIPVEEEESIPVGEAPAASPLTFRVQVVAYPAHKPYTGHHFDGLGELSSVVIKGIARYTVDNTLQTVEQAAAFKEKAANYGPGDAFITAIEKGERKYLFELVDKYPEMAKEAKRLGLNEIVPPRKKQGKLTPAS